MTVRTEKKIKRKRDDRGVNIITEPEEKVYRVFFLKRRRLLYIRPFLLVLFREKMSGVGFEPTLPRGNQNLSLVP